MNKWMTFLATCFFCNAPHAALIKYEITNFMMNLDSNEHIIAPMEITFDLDAYNLVSCTLYFDDQRWVSNIETSISVTKSSNDVGREFLEVFALFGPVGLISENRVGQFFASEWKVHSSDPNADVLSGLGTEGPQAVSLFTLGTEQFGVTSRFDRKTIFTVGEPPTIYLGLVGAFFLIAVKIKSRKMNES